MNVKRKISDVFKNFRPRKETLLKVVSSNKNSSQFDTERFLTLSGLRDSSTFFNSTVTILKDICISVT